MTPAQALAVVVPLGSHLEIEAMISNRDIAASPLQAGGPAREITPALHKEPESHIRLGTISGIGNAVRPLRSKYFRLWRSAQLRKTELTPPSALVKLATRKGSPFPSRSTP